MKPTSLALGICAAATLMACEKLTPRDIRLSMEVADCTPERMPAVERLTAACASVVHRGEDEDDEVGGPACIREARETVCGRELHFLDDVGAMYWLPCRHARTANQKMACVEAMHLEVPGG